MNLACSVGLPGAEVIDVPGCLKAIDDWAVGVRRLTEVGLRKEFRPYKEKYDYSEPLYRMVKLALTLKDHCGVRYDAAKIGLTPADPFDLHEQFIHGPIQGPGGTCATLPMLYAAVGRRLGYPVKLVPAKAHMFCRWDDPATGERVNIECTNLTGVSTLSDDDYRKWPYPITESDMLVSPLLKSLTPREELALFVGYRGNQWFERGNYRRAIAAMIEAALMVPDWPGLWGAVRSVTEEWDKRLRARHPPGFPHVEITVSEQRRRWPGIRWVPEQHLRFLEAVENLLNDPELEANYWVPLRAGQRPKQPLPQKLVVDCTGEELCTTHP